MLQIENKIVRQELAPNCPKQNSSINYIPNNEINNLQSKTNKASLAYGTAYINLQKKKFIPKSFDFYKTKLELNKIDYDISVSKQYNNYNLRFFNPKKNIEYTLHWCDGNAIENYKGWNEAEYDKYNIKKVTSFDKQGKIKHVSKYFYENDKKPLLLDNEILNYKMTPQEYVNILKKHNCNYKIIKGGEEENNRFCDVEIYDKNNNLTKLATWYYGKQDFNSSPDIVSQSFFEEGKEKIRLNFQKNYSSITRYYKN